MTLSEAARTLLGVPFRHQGRDPSVGIDCVGLLRCAGDLIGWGLYVYDCDDYARDPHDGVLEGHLQTAFGPPVSGLQVNDIVAMAYGRPIRHVGIIGTDGERLTLIHTSQQVGRVVEHGIDPRWLRRIKRVYRSGV